MGRPERVATSGSKAHGERVSANTAVRRGRAGAAARAKCRRSPTVKTAPQEEPRSASRTASSAVSKRAAQAVRRGRARGGHHCAPRNGPVADVA